MLKHANYDIENGLKSLKVGFGAIFSALINREIEVYQTEFPLSREIVYLGLDLCYNKDEVYYEYLSKEDYKTVSDINENKGYKGNILSAIIEDTIIIVVFEIDRTIFYRIE